MPAPQVILLVDCDRSVLHELEPLLRKLAVTVTCDDFSAARRRILDAPPDFLVTNLRLGAYNGLHLVQLARTRSVTTRCLVYDQLDDAGLAGTVKQAGAFYEHYNRLAASLPSYVTAELPSNDRRDPGTTDRRHTPRGGRRSSDSPAS